MIILKKYLILFLLVLSVFSGCAEPTATISPEFTRPPDVIHNDVISYEELTTLFQNNEAMLTAVVDELYPLRVEVDFFLEDSVLIGRTADRQPYELPTQTRQMVFECLKLMEAFLIENPHGGDYYVMISMSIVYADREVFVLYFSIGDVIDYYTTGIAYTTDSIHSNSFQELKPNWYLYIYWGI